MADDPKRDARIIQLALYGVALFCVLAAIGHAVWPERVDDKTAMFLGLAAAVLIIREIGKIELPGVKLERIREELKKDVQAVDKKVEVIEERGLLPGRPGAGEATPRALTQSAERTEDVWNSDPNKGKFSGSPQANGRVLEAQITPAAGPDSAACDVVLRVRSIDPARPLAGAVTFHLHPTFKPTPRDVSVVNGIAELKITSWGVFTVGAVADNGETKLELDLSRVEGGTPKFYSQ